MSDKPDYLKYDGRKPEPPYQIETTNEIARLETELADLRRQLAQSEERLAASRRMYDLLRAGADSTKHDRSRT